VKKKVKLLKVMGIFIRIKCSP